MSYAKLMNCSQLLCCLVLMTCSVKNKPAQAQKPNESPVFDVPLLNNITIDGKTEDWGNGGFRLDVLTPVSSPLRTAANFDAKARLGWSEQGLLVLVQVTDDETTEAKAEDRLGDKDSVELFLASQRGATDSYQVALSPGLNAEQPQLRWHLHDHRKSKELQQVHAPIMAARAKTDTGYILEALLPWENLNVKPATGREVAFQIGINDSDTGSARYQVMWYPTPGASSDTNKMQSIRLAQQPSHAVQAAAMGAYERFRRTVVNVTATGDFAGKPVEVREGKRRLGRTNLVADTEQKYGGKATAKLILPMPARGQAYGPLTVVVNNRPVTTVNLNNPNEARQQAFNREPIVFRPFVFSGTSFPSCDFQNPSFVEDLVGMYSLSTTYYDAAYNPVKEAIKPGRYGAIVDITTEDNKHYKRFYTLFRQPEDINWRTTHLPTSIVFPPQLGVDPVVTEEQKATVNDAFKRQWQRSAEREEDAAILLAGLHETQPGAPTVARTDVWHRDDHWWYELKQKTGDLKPLRYLLSLPQGYNDDTGKRWPLLLFLHGSGERGDDLDKVKVHGPPKLVAAGQQLPFIVVSPQCPTDERWFPRQLNDMINSIQEQHRVDTSRIYLTGLSMGGRGTWDMAMEYPDRFAAIAPIAGWGDATDVERVKNLPVWAFHGTKDDAVPYELGRQVVDALKKIRGNVKFTVYPNVGHDSWTATYDNPNLYKWFLQQRRPAAPSNELDLLR